MYGALEKVNKVLECMHISQSTDDEIDHTPETPVDSKTAKTLGVVKSFGMELFDGMNETMNVVRSSPGLETVYKRISQASLKGHC